LQFISPTGKISWNFDGGTHIFYVIDKNGRTIWSSKTLTSENVTVIPAKTTEIQIPIRGLRKRNAAVVRGIRLDGRDVYNFKVKSVKDYKLSNQ